MTPVATPSLLPVRGVPSSRSHIFSNDFGLQPFQCHEIEAKRQPPSLSWPRRTSSTISLCWADDKSPGNLVEAHNKKTLLIVDSVELFRLRYSRNCAKFG